MMMAWQDIANILFSAFSAAILTTLLAHWFEVRRFKMQTKIDYIQKRAKLYSVIIFYLEKMRRLGESYGKSDEYFYEEGEAPKIINELNQEMKDKLEILDNPDALKAWFLTQSFLNKPEGVQYIRQFRNLILKEYDDVIISKGSNPKKISI